MNVKDRLFNAESALMDANKEIALLRQEKAALGRQLIELREIISALTKPLPNAQS